MRCEHTGGNKACPIALPKPPFPPQAGREGERAPRGRDGGRVPLCSRCWQHNSTQLLNPPCIPSLLELEQPFPGTGTRQVLSLLHKQLPCCAPRGTVPTTGWATGSADEPSQHSSAPSSRTWACHQATAQNTMPNPWSFPCKHLCSEGNLAREMPTSLLLFYRNSFTPAFIQVNPLGVSCHRDNRIPCEQQRGLGFYAFAS